MSDTAIGPVSRKVSDWIPAKARNAYYTIVGAAFALEQIWDVIPEPLEGKLLDSLAALGLFMAASQTPDRIRPLSRLRS